MLLFNHVHPIGQAKREESCHADSHDTNDDTNADRKEWLLEQLICAGKSLDCRHQEAKHHPERNDTKRHHRTERETLRPTSLRGLRESHDLDWDHRENARREVQQKSAGSCDRKEEQEANAVRID